LYRAWTQFFWLGSLSPKNYLERQIFSFFNIAEATFRRQYFCDFLQAFEKFWP